MKQNKFPPGWDEKRVQRVIDYYENQTEDEAAAEDEATFQDKSVPLMEVPTELVPIVLELVAKYPEDNLMTNLNKMPKVSTDL